MIDHDGDLGLTEEDCIDMEGAGLLEGGVDAVECHSLLNKGNEGIDLKDGARLAA